MSFSHALNHVLAAPWEVHALKRSNDFVSDSDNITDSYNRWRSWYCCFRRQSFPSQLPLFSLLLLRTKEMSRWNEGRFRPCCTSIARAPAAPNRIGGKREIMKYRKDEAEVKQTKYAGDEGHTHKLGWFDETIRKGKIVLFLTILPPLSTHCSVQERPSLGSLFQCTSSTHSTHLPTARAWFL